MLFRSSLFHHSDVYWLGSFQLVQLGPDLMDTQHITHHTLPLSLSGISIKTLSGAELVDPGPLRGPPVPGRFAMFPCSGKSGSNEGVKGPGSNAPPPPALKRRDVRRRTYVSLGDMERQAPEHDGLALLLLPGVSPVVLLGVVSVRVIAVFRAVAVAALSLPLSEWKRVSTILKIEKVGLSLYKTTTFARVWSLPEGCLCSPGDRRHDSRCVSLRPSGHALAPGLSHVSPATLTRPVIGQSHTDRCALCD